MTYNKCKVCGKKIPLLHSKCDDCLEKQTSKIMTAKHFKLGIKY